MRRSLGAVVALVVAALLSSSFVLPASHAAVRWTAASLATIRPGVQTVSGGTNQCTSNFVFTDAANNTYIGQAAHCSSLGTNSDINGCTTRSMPLGTKVTIGGAHYPGVLVYNSWRLMQKRHVTDHTLCYYNDLALVRIDPRDRRRVNPSMPRWGGPTRLATTAPPIASRVYSYGNLWLRFGLAPAKYGTIYATYARGWSHDVYTVTQGIPGDSGSGFLDRSGRAFGVLSTVSAAPVPGSNGVGDLAKELAYLNAHSGMSVKLALGTVPFKGLT